MPEKYGATEADMSACAAAQQVEVRAGDVLLVRTGFAQLWDREEEYLRAAGVAKSGTLWAAARGVVAVGADNMAWDVTDVRDPEKNHRDHDGQRPPPFFADNCFRARFATTRK